MKSIMVTRSSMPDFDEYVNEIKDIWITHWLTNMGDKHEKLRKMLRQYLEVKEIELLTNGHMALELVMQAMDLKGEVITTPFTFASTTHAIVRNGLTPVFCDINYEDYTIDVSKIESLITEKTSAIVPVHVYGNVCDVETINEIANKYNLKVIYDAAHAFGEKYKGIGIGNWGDASCFSFHATKVFNTIEGGAVTFSDNTLGEKIYGLKNFGIRGPESVDAVGANAKLNEFCAAMGICNLKHIDSEIEKRKRVYEHYQENLKHARGIKLNVIQKDVEFNYSYFPIVIDEDECGKSRNDIYENLLQNEIVARKYFYPLTSLFDCYKDMYNRYPTPVAKMVSEKILTLPLYADLSLAEVDKICECILRK